MGMKTKDLVVVREGSHLMLSVVMVVRHLPMPIIQARVQGRGLEEDVVLVVLEDWVGGHQLEEAKNAFCRLGLLCGDEMEF